MRDTFDVNHTLKLAVLSVSIDGISYRRYQVVHGRVDVRRDPVCCRCICSCVLGVTRTSERTRLITKRTNERTDEETTESRGDSAKSCPLQRGSNSWKGSSLVAPTPDTNQYHLIPPQDGYLLAYLIAYCFSYLLLNCSLTRRDLL